MYEYSATAHTFSMSSAYRTHLQEQPIKLQNRLDAFVCQWNTRAQTFVWNSQNRTYSATRSAKSSSDTQKRGYFLRCTKPSSDMTSRISASVHARTCIPIMTLCVHLHLSNLISIIDLVPVPHHSHQREPTYMHMLMSQPHPRALSAKTSEQWNILPLYKSFSTWHHFSCRRLRRLWLW